MSDQTDGKPQVSVCVITYNHEDYLTQCLDSILNQKTGFSFEVIIGEDASTDGSRKVIESYLLKYQQIKLLDKVPNMGAIPNFIRTLEASSTKYIAFCEGDDYWIDELKLQKQFNFLENNPEYGGVSTNNLWYYEDSDQFEESKVEEGPVTFEALCRANVINSQSILFKRILLDSLDWIRNLKMGDWPLHLMITAHQPYYRLKDISTVYRVHGGGIHSGLKQVEKVQNQVEVLAAVLNSLQLNEERSSLLKNCIKLLYLRLIALRTKSLNSIRKKYYELGGNPFNKTILKSYLYELF